MDQPFLKTKSIKIFRLKMEKLPVNIQTAELHNCYDLFNFEVLEDKSVQKGIVYVVHKGLIVKTFHI